MLRVEQIDIDVDWYPRGGYVPDHVKMMRETLAAFPEKELPPIIVTADFKLIDGLHRTYAYKEFGRDKIPAFVQNGLGENEAWELALRLNNENSTPISFEDRRLVFERMWKHH